MLIFDATDNSFGTMSFKITVTSKWISVENIGDGRKTVTTDLPRCLSTMPYIVPNTGNKIDTQYELICGISNDWGPNTRIYKVKKEHMIN